ncbi:type A chloramphenicol O-acetyltransferase [Anaerotignum propionicum]|uniref:Chloramphenicol O-acetyltransferase type A n=1 Tax=Anaerotignum propionicum DSM 1682 TaxID=991789 RepID=A0A0X8VBK0_ANAPI|nr:type A chloramphenicol O-acetyltransferase [Anaerotignum propionicum]AMJ39909.1 chloramphenicol acetyltransferase [Anaerotignum propionicum DSM 1682]MEA5056323.1 type A chloramphenicol O-acetyltransferase [Anaerotignum propionicum]SHE27417.1 chloramphenicol O-acetyltransferase type A [[Clostridium] propionicum DSM 1682] [Anaerotignum propionicum DSM 1682]
MKFIEIQMEQWTRKAHYEHYKNNIPCSYSITVDIDITNLLIRLKERGMKSYPAQVFMISSVVNQLPEFRMTMNSDQRLGYWEVIDPMYTVFDPITETFSAVWTKYDSCYNTFYSAYLQDTAQYTCGGLFPQEYIPPNTFNISSVPWLDFTAFNINVFSDGNYLLPIFTIGKYKKENGKIMMPLAIQCHHAVCDGYHVGKFVETLREMAINCDKWLL